MPTLELTPYSVTILCLMAGSLGWTVGFWLGRYVSPMLERKPYRSVTPETLRRDARLERLRSGQPVRSEPTPPPAPNNANERR